MRVLFTRYAAKPAASPAAELCHVAIVPCERCEYIHQADRSARKKSAVLKVVRTHPGRIQTVCANPSTRAINKQPIGPKTTATPRCRKSDADHAVSKEPMFRTR